MANPKVTKRSIKDLEYSVFDKNSQSEDVKRVLDRDAIDLLQSILTALGGASNTSVSIFNVSLPLANTETSLSLPTDTKGFLIKVTGTFVHVSFLTGENT
jgi:hypothetical protein